MLPSINLLPWRRKHQQQLNERFFLHMLGTCLLAALLSVLAGMIMLFVTWQQEQRNDLLRTAIEASADTADDFASWQRAYRTWQARLSLIDRLEFGRMQTARLLPQLAQAMPDPLRLSRLQRNGDHLHIRGEAQASKAIAGLVAGMESTEGWYEVVLSDVRTVENGASHFALDFRQAQP